MVAVDLIVESMVLRLPKPTYSVYGYMEICVTLLLYSLATNFNGFLQYVQIRSPSRDLFSLSFKLNPLF